MSALRIAVTGIRGQIVSALVKCAPDLGLDVVAVGRPALDLTIADTVLPALKAARPNVIVNAAAYADVDPAEGNPELAFAVNTEGARRVAAAAQDLGVPVIQLSTDYVFDGRKPAPYVESDPVNPLSVYGRSKAAGEVAVAEAAPNHAILRLAWVYSQFGPNFVRTMLDLATKQRQINVVCDRFGCPTAATDIAAGIAAVARNLVERPQDAGLRGTFHMVGAGTASWADLAEGALAVSRAIGGPWAPVRRITDAEFPEVARRPLNSRLDCTRLATAYGVRLPHWRVSLASCVAQIIDSSMFGMAS
jgi:dTDP-4-dehydrorhamnose reductase